VTVALIGSSGKLGQAILSRTQEAVQFRCLSRAKGGELSDRHLLVQGNVFDCGKVSQVIQGADSVVFLVGFPGAPSGLVWLEQVMITNALSLAFVLQCMECMRSKARLIFISSAHVYQLATGDRDLYAEGDLTLEQGLDRWVSSTAYFLLEQAQACRRGIRRQLPEVSTYLTNNPPPVPRFPTGDSGYRFLYEVSKIVGERILEGAADYVVLRPTYCYGYTDTSNSVYRAIDGFFRHQAVELPSRAMDFVFYDDLVETLSLCWRRNTVESGLVVNVASGDLVDVRRLYQKFQMLADQLGVTLSVTSQPVKRDGLAVCSQKLRLMLNRICNRNLTGFDDGFDQVLFRYFGERVLGLRILGEYEGGSTARVYSVEHEDRGTGIFKIGLGNRAENGAQKIYNETRHLASVRRLLNPLDGGIPEVWQAQCKDNLSYAVIEHITGPSISDLIFSGRMGSTQILGTVDDIQRFLVKTYGLRTAAAPASFVHSYYRDRVFRRLSGIGQATAGPIQVLYSQMQQSVLAINGVLYRNPYGILGNLELDRLAPERLGFCVSGDLIFDNVLASKGRYFFIDPRGDVFWQENVPYFDPVYDLAKMFFYFAGWKLIRLEQFSLQRSGAGKHAEFTLTMTGPFAAAFRQIQQDFGPLMVCNCLGCDPRLLGPHFVARFYLAVATHFLSDTLPRVMGKGKHTIDQALAEFLIGTVIMNKFCKTVGVHDYGVECMNEIGVWQND